MNTIDEVETRPESRWYHRLSFWIIVSAFSAFFAETCCGNEPFVLLEVDNLFFCVTMYGMHTLILASILCRSGRVTFSQLFLAGAIFGMYEAYMTKVLWAGWEEGAFTLAGIAVVETLMLVLFWHPFMAFIIPLVFVERFLVQSKTIIGAFSPRFQRVAMGTGAVLVILPALAGLFDGATCGDTIKALASTFGSTGILLILMVIWTKGLKGGRFTINQMLPTGMEFKIMVFLLFGQYVFYILAFNPENMPGIGPQITVWILYIILISMLILSIKKEPATADPEPHDKHPDAIWKWCLFSAVFILSGTLAGSPIFVWREMLYAILFLFAVPLGCFVMARTVYVTVPIRALKR